MKTFNNYGEWRRFFNSMPDGTIGMLRIFCRNMTTHKGGDLIVLDWLKSEPDCYVRITRPTPTEPYEYDVHGNGQSNGVITIPKGTSITIVGAGGGGGSKPESSTGLGAPGEIIIDNYGDDESSITKSEWEFKAAKSGCECGSESAGIGGHSTWCPKFNP